VVVERRRDPGRELGGTASVDELEQRVQVMTAVARDRLSERHRAPDFAQPVDPPGKDAPRIAGRVWLSLDRRHAG
jgi:hypothetical protein